MSEDIKIGIRREIERRKSEIDTLEKALHLLEIGTLDQSVRSVASPPQILKRERRYGGGITMLDSIQEVLSEAHDPMSINSIYEKMQKKGTASFEIQTLRAKVYSAVKAGKIKKVGAGLFTV